MQALSQRVDSVLEAAVAGQRIVGAVAVVAQRGEVVYHRALGLADRDAGRAMTEATPFRLASLTKQITTIAALALVERGVLAFDQPVTRWLPDFTPRWGDAAPPITLHHLLSHTSGLGYGFLELADGAYHRAHVSDGLDQPGLGLAENLRRLASAPLWSAPGTRFQYSLSTDVLGGVLERAADAPLADVIAREVSAPLGLDGFAFTAQPAVAAALAVPYADGVHGAPPQPIRDGVPVPFDPFAVTFAPSRALDPASYPSGGAGLVGRAAPYLAFLEAVRTRRVPGVAPALIDRMLSSHMPEPENLMLGPGWGYGYSVAVLRDPAAAGSVLSRGSVRWGGAYGHSWWIDGARETSAVLLTNTTFEGMSGALRDDFQRAVHAAA
ncbi:MAG TPA: serine hydrolase domain-containing protein [Kofleriaceae bacterium]|nr:serine hydrolase domain-containing protein [Kofleriaceae bacterium]